LDLVAFVVSLIGSITAGLIAFSIRQTLLGESGWRALTLGWGPLVVGVAIACDFYAAAVELGLLKADYEQDMEQWLDEKRQWEQSHAPPPELQPAKKPDFERVLARLNGDRANLNVEQLESELAADHKSLPSESTVKRWLKLAREAV
jgi:uncharacterized membrane protein YhiD involved in acid resistance